MSLFRFTITNRADDKNDWLVQENTQNGFIHKMLLRGHLVGAKDGSGIIAGIFKTGTRLEQKNLETATGVIFDIDGKFRKVGDSIPPGTTLHEDGRHYLEVVPPDWLLSKLPFRGVAHSSHSHSPAHPKYRVILPFDEPVAPTEFMRMWFWLFEKVERKVDAACKNPDRMFFMPRCTEEAKLSGWPWIRPLTGPLLSYSMIPPNFQIPDEFRYELERPRKKQGAHTAPPSTHYRRTDAFKLLEMLVELPLYQWAVESADEVSREVWRGLATNIAAAVMEDENAIEAGAQAFHQISEADDNRYNHGATEKCFRDALKSAAHPGPMNYATMKLNGAPEELEEGGARAPVAHARHVLADQERSQRPKELAPGSAPSQPGAPSADIVVGEPRPLVLATETPTPDLTASGEPAPSAPTNDAGVPASEAGDGEVPPPNVPVKELTFQDHTQKDFLYDVGRGVWIMQKKDTFTGAIDWAIDSPVKEDAFNNKLVGLGLQRKQLDDWKMWIPRYDFRRAIYTHPDDQLIRFGNTTYYNTYKGPKLLPVPGPWDNIRALFLHLVGGDKAALEYLLDWIAYPLQKIRNREPPTGGNYKTGTAIVFRGDPGAGKGTAMEILMLCYGLSNCVTLGQDDLDGKFHSILVDKLFVVGNEVMSTSNRSAQTANKLKSWITDPLIPCEGKYSDANEVANSFNFVLTSNDERPVIIEKGDRRYSVFQSTAVAKSVVNPVRADLISGQKQVSAFYEHMLTRQIKMQYGELYQTEARVQVQLASAPTSERFAEALYEDGFISVAAPWIEQAKHGETREPVVTYNSEFFVISDTLMSVYKQFCAGLGAHPQHIRALTQALQQKFPKADSEYRIKVGGVKRRAWRNLPVEAPGAEVIPIKPLDVQIKATGNDDNAAFENDTPQA